MKLKRKINFTDNLIQNRINIIDWLIQIKHSLNLKEETFFLSINILDYVLIQNKYYNSIDFDLIGLVSLFISCKYFEVDQLYLNDLIEKLSNNKFSKIKIIETELQVLKILNFKIPKNKFFDYIKTNFKYCFQNEELMKSIISTYIFSLYNFNLTNFYKIKKLVKVVILFSLKLCKYENFIDNYLSKIKMKTEEIEEILEMIDFVSFFNNKLNMECENKFLNHFRNYEMKHFLK